MNENTLTAFREYSLIAEGTAIEVISEVKRFLDKAGEDSVLIFDDATGEQIDFSFNGTLANVLENLTSHPYFSLASGKPTGKGPVGRPKLGVISREVTLLPRHWEWLERQQNGASAALRRLVEAAMKEAPEKEALRLRSEAAGKVMWSLAGDLPGFEEASRALFRGEIERFSLLIGDWPIDVQSYLNRLTTLSPEI